MVEICTDILIKELWELKSQTCKKLKGCETCKFRTAIINREHPELRSETCLIDVMNSAIYTPDERKIKDVY